MKALPAADSFLHSEARRKFDIIGSMEHRQWHDDRYPDPETGFDRCYDDAPSYVKELGDDLTIVVSTVTPNGWGYLIWKGPVCITGKADTASDWTAYDAMEQALAYCRDNLGVAV